MLGRRCEPDATGGDSILEAEPPVERHALCQLSATRLEAAKPQIHVAEPEQPSGEVFAMLRALG